MTFGVRQWFAVAGLSQNYRPIIERRIEFRQREDSFVTIRCFDHQKQRQILAAQLLAELNASRLQQLDQWNAVKSDGLTIRVFGG